MTNAKQGRNRFVKYAITKDIAAKIKNELKSLETSEPPPKPPKETYTLGDLIRENLNILESLKNKKHKPEVIAEIFRQFGLDVTTASIKAYSYRIHKDLREQKESQNEESKAQVKQEVKKKKKASTTQKITTAVTQMEPTKKIEILIAGSTPKELTGVRDPKNESNTPIQVSSVNFQNDDAIKTINTPQIPDVDAGIANSVNSTENVIVMGRFHNSDIKPVQPVQMVQKKRKDDF